MAGQDNYFGYNPAQNTLMQDARRIARHMGEDIRRYPPPSSGGTYVEPTINWKDPHLTAAQQNNQNQLFMNDSIEKIYKRVMGQDASVVFQLSDQWYRVIQVIDDLIVRVRKAANGLKYGGDGTPGNSGGWKGRGADAFLARGPGATLKSLDDWRRAAVTNWLGSATLANAILNHQSKMTTLYEEYKRAMVKFGQDWQTRTAGGVSVNNYPPSLKDKYVTALRTEEIVWSRKSQAIQYAMAREYWSVMSGELTGGSATVYEGPTNAVQPNPAFISRWMQRQLGVPHIATPHIATPNIKTPVVHQPNVTAPHVTPPKLTAPNVTAPHVTPPRLTAPTVPAPNVTAPVGLVPPMPPAVPNMSGGRRPLTSGTSAPRIGAAGNLLNNLPGGKVAGVLRPPAANLSAPANGQSPPAMGQPPANGQPPPQIGGRGPGQGAPSAPPSPGVPPSPGKRGPGESTPAAPTAGGGMGHGDHFGTPPAAPSSPVLHGPRSTQSPPLPGSGARRGAPAARSTRGGPGQPGGQAPLRSDAAPPVLRRPGRTNVGDVPPLAAPRTSAHAPDSALAPPTRPTTSPVVGRAPRLSVDGSSAGEPPSGVLRGTRRSGGSSYEPQIASRKKALEEQGPKVDEDYEKIRRLLDQEEAWTVETPGGGVLDSASARAVTPATEPKPTLST